ncbi:MAG: tetratricopeptide repeat protein [Pirellulaceae bacterium]|nr:tetratricopeptide repeat protein [Pirellulaceae bacterium]
MRPRMVLLATLLALSAIFLLLAFSNSLRLVSNHQSEPLTVKQREALKAESKRLWERAQQLDAEGKLAEALQVGEQLLSTDRQLLGNKHANVAFDLAWLADRYQKLERFTEAKIVRTEAVAILVRLFGHDHWRLVDARWALKDSEVLATLSASQRQQLATAEARQSDAMRLNEEGKFSDAAQAAQEVAEIHKAILGEHHPKFAMCLNNLAELCRSHAQFARAEPLYRQAAEICKQSLGEMHPDYATCLNNLALLYKSQVDYARAEPLYRQALQIRKRALGEKHPDYAASLSNLAQLYALQGDYATAEPLCCQAAEVFKMALGENHSDYATSLNNLAELYRSQGDFARAEPLYRQALQIRKKVLGENHPQYAASLNNLAVLYATRGDYAPAEPHYRQALEIKRKALGDDHPDYALSLNNLAVLYRLQGDYARAEPLYRQALEIVKNALGENHPDHAKSLNNLADLYRLQGDYTRAEPLHRQAAKIWKEALGENHPDFATSLNNLAELYDAQRDYGRAEPLLLQAIEIRKQSLGENHPEFALSLNNLAGLYLSQGDYARAEPLYRQAAEIWKKALGEHHPDYATSLNNLALVCRSQGEYAQAESLYRQAFEITLRNVELVAALQSERQQIAMAAQGRHRLHHYLTLAVRTNDFQVPVYERLLAWKGMVLARQQAQRAVANRPEIAPIATELRTVSTQLARVALSAVPLGTAETRQQQIADLSAQKEALEGKLAAASAEFRAAVQPLTLGDVQATLPPDGALVDLLEYTHVDPAAKNPAQKWELRLAAFVVTGDSLRLVDLHAAAPFHKAIATWRLGLGTTPASKQAGQTLREKLWLPIEEHLAGAKTVLISPDGDLGKLPFAALPGKAPGSYLLEEYMLAVVPAARAIVAAPRSSRPAGNLLVLGGVDYNRQGAATPDSPLPKPNVAAFSRAARGDGDEPFLPLEGTKGELATIEKLYRATFGDDGFRSLEGAAATEDLFVEQASLHHYLHLATHGYFAAERFKSALDRSTQAERPDLSYASNQSLAGYHPGLLSGLALAGANQPTEEDDGILTAEEISALDLSGCELVVLSACETGLGRTAGGEGLLGLQRAFQTAGARSAVATLWSVDDEATRVLMERFYDNLWTKKKPDGSPLYSKLEALREAQLWVLRDWIVKDGGPRGGSRHLTDAELADSKRLPPFYWAAFVLSGDWR